MELKFILNYRFIGNSWQTWAGLVLIFSALQKLWRLFGQQCYPGKKQKECTRIGLASDTESTSKSSFFFFSLWCWTGGDSAPKTSRLWFAVQVEWTWNGSQQKETFLGSKLECFQTNVPWKTRSIIKRGWRHSRGEVSYLDKCSLWVLSMGERLNHPFGSYVV